MSQESLSECIHMNEKTSKRPEVFQIVKQLHEENRKKLSERGINA
jgi:DNA phosphorothioation-dependent restriction protein DptG